jgi:leader peptidase (prepilin peptidase)/N-methyltransferase
MTSWKKYITQKNTSAGLKRPMTDIVRLSFFICVLFLISMNDLKRGIIPNSIVYPAIIVTIVLNLVSPEASIKMSFAGAACLAGILFIPAVLLRRMGIGDVKLVFLIGLMTGFPEGIVALAGGIVLGGIFAVIMLSFRIKGRKDEMPYGPFLAAGGIITLVADKLSLLPYLYTF